MTTEAMDEFLVQGLQELCDTEQQLVDALETLADQTDDEAADLLSESLREEEALKEVTQTSEEFDQQQLASD